MPKRSGNHSHQKTPTKKPRGSTSKTSTGQVVTLASLLEQATIAETKN